MPKDSFKTLKDWRRIYKEKEELLLERGYEEVAPFAFYRELFPVGSLQGKGEEGTGRGNMLATNLSKIETKRRKQYVITDDMEKLDKVMGVEFGLIAPLSWYGKTHKGNNAHEMYAMAIDIDYVGKQQLKNLLKQFRNGVQLAPTCLVSSGRGLHLYYFLQEPVQLYKNVIEPLDELKEAMIRRLWNDTSSMNPDEPDITGIYQGFRCVGCMSKLCLNDDRTKIVSRDYIVKAYKISGQRYTLQELEAFCPNSKVNIGKIYEKPKWKEDKKKHIPMEQAKELYPEWYEERIVNGIKVKPNRKNWICNTALYDWWKNKILHDVKVGGRYYSLMALCMYGKKCGIDEKTIKKDAWAFFDHLEELTDDESNHFTRQDVREALKCLDDDYVQDKTMTREWIEKHTKVEIPPNKRNGRKQSVHVEYMNLNRKFKNMQGECSLGGRPKGSSKERKTVLEWRENHPEGKKADCIRDTGLSKPTVYRWWKEGKVF